MINFTIALLVGFILGCIYSQYAQSENEPQTAAVADGAPFFRPSKLSRQLQAANGTEAKPQAVTPEPLPNEPQPPILTNYQAALHTPLRPGQGVMRETQPQVFEFEI